VKLLAAFFIGLLMVFRFHLFGTLCKLSLCFSCLCIVLFLIRYGLPLYFVVLKKLFQMLTYLLSVTVRLFNLLIREVKRESVGRGINHQPNVQPENTNFSNTNTLSHQQKDFLEAEIRTLHEMGFTDNALNLEILKQFDGDLQATLEILTR